MDFAALQQKLFDLDPSDRAEDLRRLSESVGGAAQESVQTEENFLQESVEIAEGTMPVEGDYSLSDFAALAGVTLNEGVKDAYKAGYDNYNSLSAISGGVKAGIKPNKDSPVKPNKNTFKKDDHSWKGFLQQHTAQLQKIAANPKQKAAFDKFMARTSESEEHVDEILPALAGMAGRAVAGAVVGKAVDKLTASKKPKMPKTRNPVASHAQSSGSGVHADQNKKKQPMRKDKHKKQPDFATESIKEMLYRKLNAKK